MLVWVQTVNGFAERVGCEKCDFPLKTASEVILSNEATKRESIIVNLPDSSDEGEGSIERGRCLSCKMVPDEYS